MSKLSRRGFIKLAGTAGALSAMGALAWPLGGCQKKAKTGGRVIVVGGGFGGATCAKYIRKFDPTVEVTLIERDARFVTCPFSNLFLVGGRSFESISHGYDKLADNYGIKVIQGAVTDIDAAAKRLTLKGGKTVPYDRLVVSPGIDFRFDAIEGYDEAACETVPHAWKGGPQTRILRKQLEAMEDGGVVIIAPPGNPFRCPPGPYERASLIAHYLTQNKPKSKILILDAKDKFSKQGLFMQGWEKRYPGMIEWVKASAGGKIDRIDMAKQTLYAEFGEAHTGDVINLIPPQKAGELAHKAGLVNADGWCPVNQRTFESSVHKDVYVIGDASIAGQMPKSGYAANSQGKVCAAAIVSSLSGTAMPDPSYVNTCYSLVAPDYGISVAAVYNVTDEGIRKVKGSGGLSPTDASDEFRKKEADYASGWYASITADMFS